MRDLVGNPKDRFSHKGSNLKSETYRVCKSLLQIQHISSGLCIASEEDYSTKKAKLVLEECRDGEKAHTWFESDQNELVLGKSLCMDIKDGGRGSTLANLMKCHGSRGTQSWVWTIKVRDFVS